MGIIFGAPYASGILATGFQIESKSGYARVEEDIRNKVQSIEVVCESYGIPLKAPSLQFPLGHSMVASVIPGVLMAEQVVENLEMIRHPIPPEFWIELKHSGLLYPDAPVA